MMSEESISMIVSMPTFIKNANRLSYQLKMSRQDASQELLLELLDHRLRTWTNKDVTIAITKDLPSLKWKVKYARKDIVRKEAKINSRELTKSQMMVGMEPQASNQSETLEALSLIQELFKNKATKSWVESVLRVGQRETMANFNQTPRQFNNKLNKVCKYAVSHRERTRKMMNTKFDDKDMRELEVWTQFDQLITLNPQNIQRFINQHIELFNDLVDSPLIKKQGVLLEDFEHADVSDKKSLIKLIKKRQASIERKLTNREDK